MDNYRVLVLTVIVEVMVWDTSGAMDTLQGILQGTPCFTPRSITGCNGTLVDNFQVTVPIAGGGPPDTKMFLFTRSNDRQPEFLHDCGGSLPDNTNFDPNVKTIVFVHGWLDATCRSAWMREMRDQLFIRGEYNVILTDWTWGNTPDFAVAQANAKPVGQQMAFVLQNIVKSSGAKPEDIHVIGHSTGAHVAGFCGKFFPNLGRVTGLDPALAPFKDHPPEERLSPTDASLVDALHTNAVECGALGFGYTQPWAHADFFINGGGPIQFSCFTQILPSFLKGDILYGLSSLIPSLCSHLQAIQYYKATINPDGCPYLGHECNSYEEFKRGECNDCGQDGSGCARMGFDFGEGFVKNGTDGYRKYYLDLALTCPYCDV